jgi:hypothetical protein
MFLGFELYSILSPKYFQIANHRIVEKYLTVLAMTKLFQSEKSSRSEPCFFTITTNKRVEYDSATWYSTHLSSKLLKSNCKNGGVHIKFLLL